MATENIMMDAVKFQSTLPQRERPILCSCFNQLYQFQSTLPQRERHYPDNLIFYPIYISIHTPTKGATHLSCISHEIFNISIHTPTKGATRNLLDFAQMYQISIHTPTKGATAILTNNFLIFCSISLINFILYLQIIQILFIFRYKFIFYFIF